MKSYLIITDGPSGLAMNPVDAAGVADAVKQAARLYAIDPEDVLAIIRK